MTQVITIVPDEAELLDVARQAHAQHLHLITNGRRAALSPVVPPGWTRISVHRKTQEAADGTPVPVGP